MNINSWLARGVASVAVISCALGASACSAKQPSSASAVPDNIAQSDMWRRLASDTPASMAEVQGNTFGLSNWKQPTGAGKGQGFYGVAPLGTHCVVIVSPGILAQPGKFSLEIETLDYQLVYDETNMSIDGIQQAILSSRASCD